MYYGAILLIGHEMAPLSHWNLLFMTHGLEERGPVSDSSELSALWRALS